MTTIMTLIASFTILLADNSQELTKVEQEYLRIRAELMTTKRGELIAAEANEKLVAQIEKRYDRKFNQQKKLLVTTAKKINADQKFIDWINSGNLKEELPFDIIEYIEDPRHTFVTYDSFSKPVAKRTLVSLTFRAGQQYRGGAKGQYTYKAEGKFGFRRSRPLKNGGIGSDVIKYNIYTNKFFKDGVSDDFMQLKE